MSRIHRAAVLKYICSSWRVGAHFIILLYRRCDEQRSHQATRQHAPVLRLVVTSVCSVLSQQHFLYTNTPPTSPFESKSALILQGPSKVLQTNLMDNNQLCSRPCVGFLRHAQMAKHNHTVFIIKEEVINLMILGPCLPYEHTHVSPSVSLSLCLCVLCLF